MSDDSRRRRQIEDDDDFGPPLFGDSSDVGLTLDADPLPHWTAPATGEVPTTLARDAEDDLWESFSGPAPHADDDTEADDITGLSPVFDATGPGLYEEPRVIVVDDEVDEELEPAPRARREPGRIQIGTDPTEGGRVTAQPGRRARPGEPPPRRPAPRPGEPTRPPARVEQRAGRDMPTAIAMGVGIAAVFLAAIRYRPWAAAVVVVIILGLGAIEYFDRVRERGYLPAFAPGIVACVAAPVAVYHYGVSSLPVVVVLAFAAMAVGFVSAPSLESNPMPNMAISILGVMWVGVLGSFGTAMLEFGRTIGTTKIGTDTLTLVAIAVVANDVGGLFVGSAVGRTPLRPWISPNKSVEGLLGGTVLTLGAMFLVSVSEISTTWNSTGDLLLLGLAVSVFAPIGDLTESMFKRNLGVKDFGTIIRGHGGVLDRFDGFLFVLPAAYYLMVIVEPWVS